ncbi:MAG: FAD-dependent oxidoreductase [Candidatus Eisenbacteria bacterium]|nr:FAD-dependent oxidoreductase [Candidatus Eisenbacteria bacterium]
MRVNRRRILIIGGGAVGPKAASRARRLDPEADIKIIEKGEYVSYGACGMPYYVSGDVPNSAQLLARSPEYFREQLDVEVLTETQVMSIDRERRLAHCADLTGRRFPLPYDNLVIATGADPVIPPFEGRELAGIFKFKNLSDAVAISEYVKRQEPRRAAIIGAGLIGLEMAEAFKAKGMAVTIVEMLDWPLPTLVDFEVGALVAKHLEEKGVSLILSQKALGFQGTAGGRVKRLSTEADTVECDIALVVVGVRPNTALAREAGLEIGATGAIRVNEFLQTSDPAIYAGGDCVECTHLLTGKTVFVPLGSTANKHGRIIGTNVAGGHDAFPGILGTAIAKVFEMSVGRTGLTEQEAKAAGYGVVSSTVTTNDKAGYYPGSKTLTLKLLAEEKTGKIIGAQCAGEGEIAKRIDVIATAMSCGMNASRLANLDLAYAPPFSPAMDAVHHAANVVRNKIDGIAKGISPRELKKKLNGQEDLLVLDVRTKTEWNRVRIEDPKIQHVPLSELARTGHELCEGKEVVTLCHSSVRAYHAQKMLERKGCKNIKFLDGSLAAWPYKVRKQQPS